MNFEDDILLILLIVLCTVFVFAIIMWFINSFPLYKMAKNKGINCPWLAFIPIGNAYIMLNIPNHEFNLFGLYKESNREKLFVVYFVAMQIVPAILSAILTPIPVIGFVFSLCLLIFSLMINFIITKDILETYLHEHTILLTILSLFVPLAQTICFYVCMNKEPIDIQSHVEHCVDIDEHREDPYSIDNENNDDIYELK